MPKKQKNLPDFASLSEVVSPRILDAARAASRAMTEQSVRHALIGGLAVGSWGYQRATKDVDFLVGDEAFVHHAGGIVSFKPGVPFEVNGIAVDLLAADENTEFEVATPYVTSGLQIVGFEVLVYLKLEAFRRRDKEDVIELLRSGLSEKKIRAFLKKVGDPELVARLDELVEILESGAV